MDSRALSLLLSPEGWTLLNQLPPYQEDTALKLADGLRSRGVDPELVAAALTQSKLRSRAREKFGEFADELLFTRAGLEQATRLPVAARHARRYADAGATLVADLGCGLGADTLAMAGLGLRVLAVELEEETAALATVNLRAFENAQVRLADARDLDFAAEGVDAVFADPARRTRSGARVFDPRAYSPDLDTLLSLRTHVPNLGLKVGPGIPYRALPSETHAQWVSVDGAVVEAGLWFGDLAPEGSGRSALLLAGDASHLLSWLGDADAPAPQASADELGRYVYEPDGAVIRAGLVATLCTELDATLLDPSIAYLSTDAPVDTPFATRFRVLDSFPFGLKKLRAYLRTRNVGRVEIKKRGTAVDPDQLRQQLALKGENAATLILTRLRGKQSVLVVERV